MSCEQEEKRLAQAIAAAQSTPPECSSLGPSSTQADKLRCQAARAAAQDHVKQARDALHACQNATRLVGLDGFVTFLRAQDGGQGYGSEERGRIEAEVIFKLDSAPDRAFGFELRDDIYLPQRQAMLSLLEDAFIHELLVHVDFAERVNPPNRNAIAQKIWLTKPTTPPGQIGGVGPEMIDP